MDSMGASKALCDDYATCLIMNNYILLATTIVYEELTRGGKKL